MLKLLALRWPSIGKIRRKYTAKWLYWNGIVRLFMEIYMNLTLFSLLNLKTIEWGTNLPAVNFSNTFAILAIIVAATAPVLLIVHAARNLRSLQDDSYQSRHGAMFEGLEHDYKQRMWLQIRILEEDDR